MLNFVWPENKINPNIAALNINTKSLTPRCLEGSVFILTLGLILLICGLKKLVINIVTEEIINNASNLIKSIINFVVPKMK